jgi:ech hydrogenase subunit A
MLASVLVAIDCLSTSSWTASIEGSLINQSNITLLTICVDVIVGAYVIAKSIQHKKLLAGLLAGLQVVLLLVFEIAIGHEVLIVNDLVVDEFSVIMALVIGIIGSGICVYALGYMRDFHAHAKPTTDGETDAASASAAAPTSESATPAADRRPVFFALMFLFLSAMFGIVFFNNLGWLLCAWEVTSVCSFALIGYTRTKEAIDNSFRQIAINLLGGIAFTLALILLGTQGIGELDLLISVGGAPALALPIGLIALAAMTKAAQVPFQSWLLGAMVAPTPTSALLHSSTMVKAGVFLLIKLAPTLGWNTNGIMVMFVGALTFLFCSAVAISQSNAKRVLAYSTIANLGLIVACAGVGTPEAVWAAIFLLIFHAAAKSLLFLCVGTAEHHIASRDIEDMDNLFVRMPGLARLMALGIIVMFAAPFGMLVSKWAVIVSLVESGNLILLIILAFGSAMTFMFWAKWLGKLLGIASRPQALEHNEPVHRSEWASIALMALLAIGLSLSFPFISQYVIVPYLFALETGIVPVGLSAWHTDALAAISLENLLIMAFIALALTVIVALFLAKRRRPKTQGLKAQGPTAQPAAQAATAQAPTAQPAAQEPASPQKGLRRPRIAPIYLAGVGLDFDNRSYRDSLSGESVATQRNWYMEGWFGESLLTPVMNTMCLTVLAFGAIGALLGLGGWSL